GIRDKLVTGVQTCALPISHSKEKECYVRLVEHLGAQRLEYAKKFESDKEQCASELNKRLKRTSRKIERFLPPGAKTDPDRNKVRSEERRVGKECKANRWR